MAKGAARSQREGSGFWSAFWAWLVLTAVLAGLAGELWKPLFDVVTAIMVVLGVLAAIGSLLPDPKPTIDLAWAPDPLPAPVPRPADAHRCADHDRERAVDRLHAASQEGRLDADELEDRVGRAYAARTYGELRGLLADLPYEVV